MIGYETKGLYLADTGIISYNIIDEIESISKPLIMIQDKEAYQIERQKQYQSTLNSKFGRHGAEWLISRLNYYSQVLILV